MWAAKGCIINKTNQIVICWVVRQGMETAASVCVSVRPHTSSILLAQAPLTPPNPIWRQWVQLHGSQRGQLCSSGSATNSYDSVLCFFISVLWSSGPWCLICLMMLWLVQLQICDVCLSFKSFLDGECAVFSGSVPRVCVWGWVFV